MQNTDTTTKRGRRARTAMLIAVTALLVAPIAAHASNAFNDVPDSNVFHDDITWMRDNGVTLGCNPPANDEYCPSDFVSREQMAAFMHRLADNLIVPNPIAVAREHDAQFTSNTGFVDLPGATVEITVPEGRTALVVAEFTAESRCSDTNAVQSWCMVRIMADGTQMEPADGDGSTFAFDSSDQGNNTVASWEAHAVARSLELGEGTHTINVQWGTNSSSATFQLDELHLLVEAHLQ